MSELPPARIEALLEGLSPPDLLALIVAAARRLGGPETVPGSPPLGGLGSPAGAYSRAGR
jgi:hypothetical protein